MESFFSQAAPMLVAPTDLTSRNASGLSVDLNLRIELYGRKIPTNIEYRDINETWPDMKEQVKRAE